MVEYRVKGLNVELTEKAKRRMKQSLKFIIQLKGSELLHIKPYKKS